jgi:flagellar protein FlaI
MAARYAQAREDFDFITAEGLHFEGNSHTLEFSITKLPMAAQYDTVTVYQKTSKTYYYHDAGLSATAEAMIVLTKLAKDDNLEDIMYDGSTSRVTVYHNKFGMCETNIHITPTSAATYAAEVAKANNKLLDPAHASFDGVVGSDRINVVIPPLASGITITIRRFKQHRLTILDLIRTRVISAEAAAFLWIAMSRFGVPKNILISGGTGTGKTTMLNILSVFIPSNERIITIEDTGEIQLDHPNVVKMISNPDNNVDMDSLLINALRMRPDRIIVGEVRGKEAITLFTAMNTGHEGCMGTLHANTAKELVTRITNAPMNVPQNMLSALNLIVIMKRMPDGSRCVYEISEITGADNQNVRFNKLYSWNAERKEVEPTGVPSRLRTKLAQESTGGMQQYDAKIARYTQILQGYRMQSMSPVDLMQIVDREYQI